MNIVFVIDHYDSKTNGTIISAKRFEDELLRQGHNVKVVSYGALGDNKFCVKENRMPIVSRVAEKSNVHFAKFDKEILKKAFKDADIVHLFMPFRFERKALSLAKSMNIPATAAFHVHPDSIIKNCGFKKPPKIMTGLIFWYWRVSFFDRVISIHCPSEFVKAEIAKYGYKAKPWVISNGFDKLFEDNSKLRTPYDKSRPFEIIMVGRLAAEKRQDILIKAVLASKYKDIINITFAGDGPLKKHLIKAAEALPNPPKFEFFTCEKLIEKLLSSDLFVHASDLETEGISCLEAIATGIVPIIGNAQKSAARQFIIDERCSFDADCYLSLKDAIEYLIEHPEEISGLSQKYLDYSKNFNLSTSVSKMTNMFADSLANRI